MKTMKSIYTRAILLIVLLGAVYPAQGQCTHNCPGVFPILECVSYNASANEVTATWGYINTNPTTSNFGISSNNFFDPPPGNRGQPIPFSPGVHHNVFSTTWSLNSFPTLSWSLDGTKVTASNDPA